MGTEFGLEAMLDARPVAAASTLFAAADEPPLAWLGRTAMHHPG